MPVPAADYTVPIAVLVLAWDETTPAVRALVEATQAPTPTVESILVMVPQATNPDVLSAEEYLPLAPAPTPTPQAALPSQVSALPPAAARASPEPATAILAETEPITEASEAVLPLPVAAPLAWSAVRVLRLGSLSLAAASQRAGQPLPAPIWLGMPMAPAAPYQGATVEPAQLAAAQSPVSEEEIPSPARTTAPVLAPAPPPYETAEPLSQGADLEADLLPAEAEELAHFELATAEVPALRAHFENLAAVEDGFSAPQASWAGALATLQQPEPAAPVAPTPPPAVQAGGANLPARPAASQYEVPDLNFRIIQYARFAVPVALAEEPYAAIYAPAWPTWLAAQELRQRTGWPLVLHVTTLAAGADESLDTATSWMAELQRQALRRADVVLAETAALTQRLRHELSLPAATVHTVPAADAAAIAQALHAARPRPTVSVR
ncbi:hypothetical protein E4631_01780 [Hymenobacter sp. UV11]|uniref:glycosyltransferase n=1 Tax=Hymenobacter sp. UV11 TaxID=1849735 RepID=UPI00105E2178|nr:glycosyltransferase [Hymenobacter sp. UV11]TDN37621.1 hypothetical protein A8B98_03610 [Hymenobacter sp. UV11]TFZ68817.1 hypothetical protein E4631_01780 [Hymenobacter sp. UV11]